MSAASDKLALVTGGCGLIGSAIVHQLAARGHRVAVASRDRGRAESCVAAAPPAIAECLVPVALDLRAADSMAPALRDLQERVGTPDVLIANASLRDDLETPFDDLQARHFTQLFEVDVAGHFNCARAIVEQHANPRGVSIVFLSSIYACRAVDHGIYPDGTPPTPVQYAATKAGVVGLSRYLAGLWGERGVRVNAVVAGGVLPEDEPVNELVERYSARTMLGRMAQPREIAAAVAFLASDEASYITGSCLTVDGGLSAW